MFDMFMVTVFLIVELLLIVAGFIAYKHLTGKETGSPLFMRCSCNHLASQHNISGCCVSGCACRVTAHTVRKHGTYDNAMVQQFDSQYRFPELAMGMQENIQHAVEQEIKRLSIAPTEVMDTKYNSIKYNNWTEQSQDIIKKRGQ